MKIEKEFYKSGEAVAVLEISPVLVHIVSQRAWVLRLRRTDSPLASSVATVLPSSYSK